MSSRTEKPFRGGVRSIARSLALGALAASIALGAGMAAVAADPRAAWAADDAEFAITNNTSDDNAYTYEGGVLTVRDGADLTISTNGQISHRIVVAEDAEATITLNGVHIEGGSATNGAVPVSAIDIADNASILLKLADGSTNTLIGGSGNTTSNGVAGIHVPEKAALAILGAGSLTVAGGDSKTGYAGSGIGGNASSHPDVRGEACGTVVILATGNVEISGGKGMNEDSHGDDIGGGKGFPQSGGDAYDGGGIRPTGDGNYVVWGEPILPDPPNNYTIPEGATLTVPSNAALCIPTSVTLTNHGTITGEGNLNGDGTLDGNGVVTVGTNNFQKNSALTLTIEGGMILEGGPYITAYDTAITLKAEVKRANARALSAGDYNTVTFYVGTGDSKRTLGTAKVENNEANLTNVKIATEQGWVIGRNTITAEFSGHSHLEPAAGTATLTVGKGRNPDAPNAPSDVSEVTATSVTLEPSIGSDVKGDIQYGYIAGTETSPTNWQASTTFENLTPATTYTFYTRYMGNDIFMPSPPSDTGLTVVTAPAADAVTINFEEETIAFDMDKVEVNPSKEFTGIDITNKGDIRAHMGSSVYVRAYSSDADAPIRGVTELQIPYRPASPSPKSISVSAENQQDGKIFNLTPNADYQISTDSNTDNKQWTDRTTDANGMISNLAAGTYWVRTKATPTQFAGASDDVTIGVGNPITIEMPTFDPVYVDYTQQPDPKRITIQNSSDQDVTLTGLHHTGEPFIVQSVDRNYTVPAGGSNTNFTVQPGEKLGVGDHTATITAEYSNGQTATANVRFTVMPRPVFSTVGGGTEPEEGKDWNSTFRYGDELRVGAVLKVEEDKDSDEDAGPNEGAGEGLATPEGATDGSRAILPAPELKGKACLYFGDELLVGPVEVEGGDIMLAYDTRGRGIPASDEKRQLRVVFEGDNAPSIEETIDFKLVKALAVELTVAGEAVEGSTLEASFPDARDNEGAAFRWLRDGEPIPGATGSAYKLTAEDAGHKISVEAKSDWHEGVSRGAALVCAVRPGGPAAPGPGKPGLPTTGDPAAAIGIASALGAIALGTSAVLDVRRRR